MFAIKIFKTTSTSWMRTFSNSTDLGRSGQHQGQHQGQTASSIYGFNLIGGGARVVMGNAGGDLARSLFQPEPG
ncbi:hypothetical protein LTR70_004741 [Exophiala xenobiotica]|uniref:Uncharacterized protein n=1 Tax=Lithohypha guttulata TaxID=1690604 RepID=A0ABR0KCC1_9EURO|nr:hypothetical protein LTR24_004357 [Lithohypha guttulata]KAK5319955.1 hypothetical protein LTR70_004741 [Exophiala xenobiotica]